MKTRAMERPRLLTGKSFSTFAVSSAVSRPLWRTLARKVCRSICGGLA